jgi:N-dimethylarginine dimethylaminohydrolase
MANQTSATPETNVDFNGHSMVGRLERVIVCSPRTAGWDDPDRLSRWQELGFLHRPDVSVAQAQHETLCEVLQRAEAEVVELAPAPDLTLDAVYTHDASLPTDFGLIPLNPGKANRVPEAKHHRDFLRQIGASTLGEVEAPGNTEAGDMVWLDAETLLIGHGYRTNRAGIEQMRAFLQPHGVEVIAAPLPYGPGPSACLHLMSLISLLDETTALVDLPWLTVETVELLKARGYRFIEIDYAERQTLACNVLSLGENRLVAIDANEKTNQRLRDAEFEVFTFPGSEICINGSGGPTCLTRPLLRG